MSGYADPQCTGLHQQPHQLTPVGQTVDSHYKYRFNHQETPRNIVTLQQQNVSVKISPIIFANVYKVSVSISAIIFASIDRKKSGYKRYAWHP